MPRLLIDLDVGCLGDCGPSLEVVGDRAGELFRVAADRIEVGAKKSIAHFGELNDGGDLGR